MNYLIIDIFFIEMKHINNHKVIIVVEKFFDLNTNFSRSTFQTNKTINLLIKIPLYADGSVLSGLKTYMTLTLNFDYIYSLDVSLRIGKQPRIPNKGLWRTAHNFPYEFGHNFDPV